MRTVISILTVFILASCNNKTVSKKTTLYYVIDSERQLPSDTIQYNEKQAVDTADIILAKTGFMYKNKEHGITVYTSDNHAPIDGGRLYYTLDTLGIIYERSTTWWSCLRLYSNNDSINDLISQALGHILMKPDLHCYQCRRYDKSPEVVLVK